ncbi:MAG: TolC family protein [Opitutaceae bacterium]|nr:TolC family protein [Opitutaceae bacterium]
MRARCPILLAPILAGGLLASCASAPSSVENSASEQMHRVGGILRADGANPALPELSPDSPPAEFVHYALLNHPAVVAAYYDWRADVEVITAARALPDPQFTLQADIAGTLMSFMPGLMFDFMAQGKRAAMGREAAATSGVSYRTYVAAVLRTAADVRKAWIELAYVDEMARLREGSLSALDQGLALANIEYATGRGMSTLETQVRLTNEIAKVRNEISTLSDRRTAARVRFKSALGLAPSDIDPPWPTALLTVTPLPPEDELWRRAQAANPELGRMRAMVDMAMAGMEVARSSRTPDFALGAMVDLKANPLMARPTASVTLPIWRAKIAATIAAAGARRDAAAARLSAEQINLAAELAQMLYIVREADRMIIYLDGTALPNLDRSIATVEAAYQSGMTGAAMIPETRLMALRMRQERAAALRDRETAATDLLLLTADVAPEAPPLLAEQVISAR